MAQIPDAPWIQDAERNGIEGHDGPPPKCPICGSTTCDQIYLNKYSEEVGCEDCLTRMDVWDWAKWNEGEE